MALTRGHVSQREHCLEQKYWWGLSLNKSTIGFSYCSRVRILWILFVYNLSAFFLHGWHLTTNHCNIFSLERHPAFFGVIPMRK